MKLHARKTTTTIAAFATAGVGTMFLSAAPATAATANCGPTGTLVSPEVCELVFTESGTFTRTAEMTKLEVLLVGAGGNAEVEARVTGGEFPSNGYAAAGGGGEVRVVDFSDASGEIEVGVGTPGGSYSYVEDVDDALYEQAVNGLNGTGGTGGSGNGGASGNGNLGQDFVTDSQTAFGAGGGAAEPGVGAVGGAGVDVGLLAPADSLFAGYEGCFGGGGGVGFLTTVEEPVVTLGGAGCGGGYPVDESVTGLVPPAPNSGGGAGAINYSTGNEADYIGADGVVVVRWPAKVLAATGAQTDVTAMSVGIAALVAGIGLAMAAAYTRKRRES